MKPAANPAALVDETLVTEISIGADGRVCIFGLSREVLEVMADLEPANHSLQQRLRAIRQATLPGIAMEPTSEQRDA